MDAEPQQVGIPLGIDTEEIRVGVGGGGGVLPRFLLSRIRHRKDRRVRGFGYGWRFLSCPVEGTQIFKGPFWGLDEAVARGQR